MQSIFPMNRIIDFEYITSRSKIILDPVGTFGMVKKILASFKENRM